MGEKKGGRKSADQGPFVSSLQCAGRLNTDGVIQYKPLHKSGAVGECCWGVECGVVLQAVRTPGLLVSVRLVLCCVSLCVEEQLFTVFECHYLS